MECLTSVGSLVLVLMLVLRRLKVGLPGCFLQDSLDILCSPLLLASWTMKRLEERMLFLRDVPYYVCMLFISPFVEIFMLATKMHDLCLCRHKWEIVRQWFQPVEASRLRTKIWKFLKEEFQNASKSNCSKESSPLSDASDE
ncbi:uncharacterized protein LOC112193783 [Rosa chinensis]|uniref:uncharacterized protein LOC112193783 n=1 Tax=Rosa chinensis TaxID=74649 RepID=UPI001AD8DB10|nr:uncharacterized protein LOC112193783 [Rosa chinensis]